MNMITHQTSEQTKHIHTTYRQKRKKNKKQKTSLIAFALDKTHFTDSIHQTFN